VEATFFNLEFPDNGFQLRLRRCRLSRARCRSRDPSPPRAGTRRFDDGRPRPAAAAAAQGRRPTQTPS
jgi:hypothetical protein